MKNIAVIFAGGTGQRMTMASQPKQFMEHDGKPILVYTLEKFQNHAQVDGIVISMLESWIDHTWELVQKYGLTKVRAVVAGGKSGQESIYHGLKKAAELADDGSIVLIHDGVRPLVDGDTIAKAICCAREKGSAITTAPAIETITVSGSDGVVGQIIDRSRCQMARAPQCFVLGELISAHELARKGGVEFIDSACLMQHYGHTLYSVEGPAENIKITTPIDYAMFCAIVDAQKRKDAEE